MTSIVNMHKVKGQPRPKFDIWIDRHTIFGNKHIIGYCNICKRLHDRKDSISEFRKDFYKRLKETEFKKELLKLKNKTLACWCKPLDCHGDVIIEYLDNF